MADSSDMSRESQSASPGDDAAPQAAALLVRQIHDSGRKLVLAVTGGGSGVIERLLSVPGASRSVLEARVPYAATAMHDWLRAAPESYCSTNTARDMAMAAWQRADCLAAEAGRSVDLKTLVGMGATASLASDRPKRGAHRVHAAAQTLNTTRQITLTLDKGARTREEEEQLVTTLLLNLVAQSCGVSAEVDLSLTDNETPEVRNATAPTEWQELLQGQVDRVSVGEASAGEQPSDEQPHVVFPGAFNPRHSGHREMATIAARVTGCPVAHELSIDNVDKPPLDFIEIEDRLAQFDVNKSDGSELVWLTRAATFVAKAELFPGATFVVGADTLRRIAKPKYYQAMKITVDDAIDRLVHSGCRFLMFGRVNEGEFCTLDDLGLPARLAAICQEVPECEFRDDVSSTWLRKQAAAAEE